MAQLAKQPTQSAPGQPGDTSVFDEILDDRSGREVAFHGCIETQVVRGVFFDSLGLKSEDA